MKKGGIAFHLADVASAALKEEEQRRSQLPTLGDVRNKWKGKVVNLIRGYGLAQTLLGCLSIFVVIWAICASVMLFQFASRYLMVVVDDNRLVYVTAGTVSRAQTEAERLLYSSIVVRDAVHAAVRLGTVSASTDYEGLERALAATFLERPSVRSVDLAFSGGGVVSLGRASTSDGSFLLTMKANSEDCFLLGVDGCMAGLGPGERPSWYNQGMLMDSSTAGGEMGGARGDAHAWDAEPTLETHIVNRTAEGVVTSAWFPTYYLLFRLAYRTSVQSTSWLYVVGRVALELGDLSGSSAQNQGPGAYLQDPALGGAGRVYVVTLTGTVIASKAPSDLLKVEYDSGQPFLNFRKIWEVSGRFSSLREAFTQRRDVQVIVGDNSLIAMAWLEEPLRNFAVVIDAPETEPFANPLLADASVAAFALAAVPYVGCLIPACTLIYFQIQFFRKRPHLLSTSPQFFAKDKTGKMLERERVRRLSDGGTTFAEALRASMKGSKERVSGLMNRASATSGY